MSVLDDRLREIYRGPSGPSIGAFFDYDGTVIGGFSARAFYTHRVRNLEIGPFEMARTVLAAVRGIEGGEDFAAFLDMSLAAWAGKPIEELEELAEQLFKHDIASRLHHEVWQLIEAHKRMGHTIALASSATRFQVEPMARAIDADAVLCTQIEERDGVATGRVAGAALWGDAKGDAVRALASERGIELVHSYGYSNGDEDIPFLEAVGRPCAVEPEDVLAGVAKGREWPILRCVARGGTTPNAINLARTAGFYGGVAAAFTAGIGAGLLNRSRRTFLDITGGLGADLGLALAGVDVRIVRGREHLWSSRPCVFVFNHQSKLDPILMMKLLREDFTGVAKKEAANVPGFGQLFRIAGVAFVDRGNTKQAKQVLEPAIAKVRDEGLSLVVAPEGTRSPTPRLGPFKKGAFHIAMQAGVPMVGIVIRNAGEVMWRGAQTISAGTVEVVVLPPVDTSAWRADTVADHVAEVRQMFLDTLADWPGSVKPRRRPARRAPRSTKRPPLPAAAQAQPSSAPHTRPLRAPKADSPNGASAPSEVTP
jgi:putative phosphoserine phosphatase/1-acylglycerol-3-phosphate O-acyltransferase